MQTVEISVPTWNKIDAILKANSVGDASRNFSGIYNDTILIRNDTGGALSRFNAVGIGGVVFDPSTYLATFQSKITLTGAVPAIATHTSGRFAVCAQPILSGKIGKAWVSGVCPALINVTDEMHEYADIADGITGYLASAESGPCVILWKESGTGQKWAVVRFGSSAGGGSAAETQYAIVTQTPEYNEPTKAKFIVQKASIDTDSESETYNQWIGDGTDIDIERALGFEGNIAHEGDNTAKDIRNWHTWPAVGSIVPIIQKWDYEQATPALRWYIDIDMDYGGDETVSSIRMDDATLIKQAVWA